MQKPIADMQIKPVDFLLNIWYCRLRTPSVKVWLSLLLKLETGILAVTAFYNLCALCLPVRLPMRGTQTGVSAVNHYIERE
ncbi:MAG TPA: hypothetical protein ACFYD4_13660 [Candidatus Wunengus sp. YC61]|uniref:hypothetical protein n=1 Tax=Candidatus Wunengus sp. YC61 TaxID=3367698 RepID=UPI004029C9BD